MKNNLNQEFKTTCSYCGTGCGITVSRDSYGAISVKGDKDYPVNRGMLCSKGLTINYAVTETHDRLLYPELRLSRSHPRERVSWDVAIKKTAAVFKTIIEKYGPDSVGVYVSGQCLTEEYYLANKLTKGFLGTNNIDTNSRLCMSSAVVGYKKAFGEDAVPICYDDIELADVFFITGANPAWAHPILFRRLDRYKRENPMVKVIVADPRATDTAAIADIHLPLNPGTDVFLNNAIGRIIIENGHVDQDFIDKNTDGFEAYKESVFKLSVLEYAEICGLNENDIRKTAEYIGEAKGFISMWTMGLNQSAVGVKKNSSLINLSLITGKVGKPGNGPFSLTGQPNAMGGREVGGLANMLAVHKNIENETHRKEVADFWGVKYISDKPGLPATKMFEALESGKLKAIWIVCTNPMVSLPNVRQVEKALKKAAFVVVQDISKNSDTVAFADVVLPAAGYMEKEGTMTNSERRISYLPKIINAPGEALPDSDIFIRFAKEMGWEKSFNYGCTEDIYQEYTQLTKGTNLDITGLNYSILKERRSAQWPYNIANPDGTDRLFTDFKFFTPNQKAQIQLTEPELTKEETSEEFPYVLTTGRIRDQWHTMTRTGKVNKLNKHKPAPYVEINPEDAEKLGIKAGDVVVVHNSRGELNIKADVTPNIKKGTLFIPMHWGKRGSSDKGRANNVTSSLVDPVSNEPDFKFSAVGIKLFQKKKQKICIVGAGAAAFRFIGRYRKKNTTDEIEVFSNEPVPFYNRILLPSYISGDKEWESLIKENDSVFHNVTIHTDTQITEIDKKSKKLKDQNGKEFHYDVLILATGSRPFVPNNVPSGYNIFSLRKRDDADSIKKLALKEGKATIIGAGLLGIELADSLVKMGVHVTIVQRTNRVMERQLDIFSSHLLGLELNERGINIIYNDEVQKYYKSSGKDYITLKSGRTMESGVVVYAIGTRPNIEIAQKAGIHTLRGVTVNASLETSHPGIFALGEIAEYNHQLYGITAAAEEQADLLAEYLLGDATAEYKGSLSINILKVDGLELCSMGQIEVPQGNSEFEVISIMDEKRRYYKKCIIRNDKLVGAILMGDRSEMLEFKDLIKNQTELGGKRKTILVSTTPSRPVKGKLVCSCNQVGKGNIQEEIDKGCDDLDNLIEKTQAGTGCGSCRTELMQMLKASKKAVPESIS